MALSAEPPFLSILPSAEALAGRRHEAVSAAHLLAALGASGSGTAAVLDEFGAGPRRVLDEWERRVDHGPGENLLQLSNSVRDCARRYGASIPLAPHLLLVLLNDSRGGTRATLERMGIDVAQLRARVVELVQSSGSTRSFDARVRPTAVSTRPSASKTPSAPQASPASLPHPTSARFEPVTRVESPAPPRGVAISVMSGEPIREPKPAAPAPTPGQALPFVPRVGPVSFPKQRHLRTRAAAASASEETSAGARERAELRERSEPQERTESEPTSAELRFGLPKKKFPILTTVGRNLTLLAFEDKLDPVVGRDSEVEQALDILAKRQGNNPCLIGPAGVGKTAVARGVAAHLASDQGDPSEDRIVIEIPIAELVAGTGVRGALAGRLAALKKEVTQAEGRVILFFDEMHQLFSGDAAEEMASDLKLALSRGELPCIGATTTDEYRRVIEKDPALSRRFTPIEIEEPSREDAYRVLSTVAEKLERHHRIRYDEEALALSIAWSMRYLPGRCLPDKAVSVIDLAGARSRRRGRPVVDPEAVAEVIAGQAGLPISRLLESDSDRMLQLEQILMERVIGHEAHIQKMARILRRNAAGLGSRRPVGTFLLLGPTGVGKTETAKAIAEVLFHSDSAMTRIDMAEMSEAHAVAKLVGAPPGYVGHDAGGQLTEAVRRRPYQVVLLDEIEKAHPEVLTAFLAVFDEGRMTDSRGRLVDFTNTVIVLTSNLGASETAAVPKKRVGFGTNQAENGDVSDRVTSAARRALPPELYNRLDEVLCFAPLTRVDVRRIGRKMIGSLAEELAHGRGIALTVEDSALEVLLDLGGFDPEFGARPLRRTLARRIEAPLAEAILAGRVQSGDEFVVRGVAGDLEFETLAAHAAE